MTGTDAEDAARGFLALVAIAAGSIGVGELFGAAYGWLTLCGCCAFAYVEDRVEKWRQAAPPNVGGTPGSASNTDPLPK